MKKGGEGKGEGEGEEGVKKEKKYGKERERISKGCDDSEAI